MRSWLVLLLFVVACNNSNSVNPPIPNPGTPPSKSGLWSDPKTWPSGKVPVAGEVVTVPADTAVTLDVSPPDLRGLTILGHLKFGNQDIALNTEWIMVHGRLEIGTPDQPYTKKAVITLTDTVPGENVMGMGDKVIGVMGGILVIQGEKRTAWTKLAANAAKGATQISVLDAAGWRVGDRIVLASTDYNPEQAEERGISALSGNTLTLDSPLKYPHFGEVTFEVDERGEVGLLSRNIKIQTTAGLGGHVMAMEKGQMYVSGLELSRMGQTKALGRYPIHWHLVGDAAGQYVQNSSIHDSLNRCVTVHGTNQVKVAGNVAYNTIGHCYFMEDGIETGNLFENNLGILTKKPKAGEELIPTDANPSTFWITNPNNTVRGNVAAGSQHTGIWLAFPEHPTGASKSAENDKNVWPRRTPLGEFSGNVAHSNWDGLMVDRGPSSSGQSETTVYNPRQNPAGDPYDDSKNPPVLAEFKSFTGYKNRGNAVWLRGVNHKMSGARLADNAIGVTFASDESVLTDSLLVGDSANKGYPESWEKTGPDGRTLPRPWDDPDGYGSTFPIRGFEFYDGKMGFSNVTFRNFQPNTAREAAAMSYLRFTDFNIDAGNYAQGAKFDNAKAVYLEPRPEPTPEQIANDDAADGYRASLFTDLDGSITGTANRVVVINTPFLVDANCTLRAEWNAQVCNYAYGRLYIENLSKTEVAPITLTRQDGASPTFRMWGTPNSGTNTNFQATLMVGRNYGLSFTGSTPAKLRLSLRNRKPGESVRIGIPFSGTPSIYRDYWIDNRNKLAAVASLAELDSSTGDKYFSDGSTLYLKLVIKNEPGRDWATLDVCAADLCK